MIKKSLLVVAATTLSVFASIAFAEEFRVVVTPKYAAPIGLAKLSSIPANTAKSIVIEASSQEEAIAKAKASGAYKTVEPDYVVTNGEMKPKIVGSAQTMSTQSIWENDLPNDPRLNSQLSWFSPNEKTDGTNFLNSNADILKSRLSLKPKHKVRVGVVDSSFALIEDLDYSEGYHFVSPFTNFPRGPNYITKEEDLDLYGLSHGTSVAAIISAKTNNGIDIAGVAPSEWVEIVAAQALLGGSGIMSDVAESVMWLAGETIPGVPNISAPVDLINMSLGGKADYCPEYIQMAIDKAYARGITVVVAAGNDNIDASKFAPANCNHVIVVGAVTRYGDKASFSNYGSALDVVAHGVNVPAPGSHPDKIYSWDGTSQATPQVLGIIALAKTEYPWLSPDESKALLRLTADSTVYPTSREGEAGNDCSNGRCGAGRADALKFLTEVRALMNNPDVFVKNVMNEECASSQVSFFAPQMNLCNTYELKLSNRDEAGVTYDIYEVSAKKAFTLANAVKVMTTGESSKVTSEYAFKDTAQYGYVKCVNGSCSGLSRMGTSALSKPAQCK